MTPLQAEGSRARQEFIDRHGRSTYLAWAALGAVAAVLDKTSRDGGDLALARARVQGVLDAVRDVSRRREQGGDS